MSIINVTEREKQKMNKNNSKIYTSTISYKAQLQEQLALVEEYLTPGQATSRIHFLGSKGQNLQTLEYNSNWTTSQGKRRVETLHKQFIDEETTVGVFPAGTVKVKITSPFVRTLTVQVTAPVETAVSFAYTASA